MTSRPLGRRQTPVCDTPANLREQTVVPPRPTAGVTEPTRCRTSGCVSLGAGVDAAHIHEDIIMGSLIQEPGPNGCWRFQPGYILPLTALDRMGRDTLCLFRWTGRGSSGVGHAGPCQGGGGDQSTHAEGGVGAAKGNTGGQCWIVPQAWIRTVRSKRNVLSLPVHGLTCKLCRCRFPVPPVGRTCFFAFGPNSDFLLRRLYASDVILVAGPAVSERLTTYLFYFQRSGL